MITEDILSLCKASDPIISWLRDSHSGGCAKAVVHPDLAVGTAQTQRVAEHFVQERNVQPPKLPKRGI